MDTEVSYKITKRKAFGVWNLYYVREIGPGSNVEGSRGPFYSQEEAECWVKNKKAGRGVLDGH